MNKSLLRIADREVGLHKAGGVVQGEPVFGRQFIRRETHQLVEIRQVGTAVGSLAGDDRDRIRTDHLHRSIIDAIIDRRDPSPHRDHITALELPGNVDTHCRAGGGAGIADRQVGLHKAGGVVQREPVFGRQFVRRESHHLIEIRQVGTAIGTFAGDDRDRVRTDHPHRSIIDVVVDRRDPPTHRDHITALRLSSDRGTHIRTIHPAHRRRVVLIRLVALEIIVAFVHRRERVPTLVWRHRPTPAQWHTERVVPAPICRRYLC